jgi:pyruvate/2-oxoglutarate/acetoin dehydrogenase E1 component
LAAVVLEAGISARYGRVCTQDTIPYARALEDEVLPNVGRIVTAAMQLVEVGG